MIHPHTELRWINDQVGRGVFATRHIPRGTLLWTQCAFDIVMTSDEVEALSSPCRQIAMTYGYVDQSGDTILCWDDARYINHSCEPSMLSLGAYNEICVRDLAPGDELTCDYGVLNYVLHLRCACGQSSCRGEIRPDDALSFGDDRKIKLEQAIDAARGVHQPLLPFLRTPLEWAGYLSGDRLAPSLASHYFDRTAATR